jgi:magnesium-transporting ATPase (P-type)
MMSFPDGGGRKRGYSLRTQLFFKNSQKENPDVELGQGESNRSSNTQIEMRNMDTTANSTVNLLDTAPPIDKLRFSSDDEHNDTTFTDFDNVSVSVRRNPHSKMYVGKRGRVQKKLTNLKNLILNIRPYKTSKGGRKIPISATGDYSRDEFPSHAVNGRDLLKDERYKIPYINNVISSSRYSIYSFVPKQLYAQFSKIANIYFLTVSILQMIPSWSTTGTYTTIIPLAVFVTISMLREGYDDWRRHLQDNKENNMTTKVISDVDCISDVHVKTSLSTSTSQRSTSHLNSGASELLNDVDDEMLLQPNTFTKDNYLRRVGLAVTKTKWRDLKVGDLIELHQDEPVPADIIVLTSDGQNENEVFVETMDLDGETNLKSRIPHRKISAQVNSALGLKEFSGSVTIEDPNTDLYNFEGIVKINGTDYPLGPENVIYRGSIIRNTENVVGLVIFTGEETKIRMNAIKNPRTKAPKLQRAINTIVVFMVFVVLALAMFSFMAQRLFMNRYWNKAWYLYNQEAGVAPTIMSFIIMYNTLIPLSLYVTMEIIKVVQMFFLHWDIDMYHKPSNTPCEARTATILEELGQVSYVFSDKTGTLTDNMMIFRKFSIAGTAWWHDLAESKDSDTDQDDDGIGPRASIDIRRSHTRYIGRPSLASALTNRGVGISQTTPLEDKIGSDIRTSLDLLEHIQTHPNTLFSKKVKFFILSLALCHTCLPKSNSDDVEDIEYQSSSPDELALVVAARDMGYAVFSKSHTDLTIRTYPNGLDEDPVDEVYQILNVVDFSSARKRMSVVVKFPDGRICMICKGADNVIMERLKNAELVKSKQDEVFKSASIRKANEASVVLQQRLSMDVPRKSLQFPRSSISSVGNSASTHITTIDDFVHNAKRDQNEIDEVVMESRKSLHYREREKYQIKSVADYIGNDKLVLNEEYLIEKTLQHIEEFSTEGLRTLLFGFKWLGKDEYEQWALDYASAKTSLVDRANKIEEVGCQLEDQFELLGATAIEDKLQDGVADTIEKLRRADIKLWMLTGDKRETAINIGYSCKLIKDYSTLVVLDAKEGDLTSKMTAAELEINNGNVAHCVVVIDGATLADFEADISMMSIFISLCTKTNSVICCRASPSQKALMVSNIRNLDRGIVTLAIGDGANDIAMIQSADIGIGITGKEGLQAARSSDYSIAQFRYLQKLLFVHGRYNYIRTSKFVLSTFYKELLFYLSQAIFQRNDMFTGTSLYEPWSLSMFNTLFTSLPVLCIGMFEKDLKPATLLAAPELYAKGKLNQAFNLRIFISWMVVATTTSLLICFTSWYVWGFSATLDNTLYPLGVLTFTAIVFTINMKLQMFEQHDRTWLNFASMAISCLGWLLWCCILPALYSDKTSKIYDAKKGIYWKFGKDITWWASLLILVTIPLMYDFLLQMLRYWFLPNDVDEFQILEKNTEVRRTIELAAFDQMEQGWKWDKDETTIKRLIHNRKRKNTVTLATELPPGAPSTVKKASSLENDSEYEVLPSGKLIKRRMKESSIQKLGRKLKLSVNSDPEENVDDIIEHRLRDLE